MSNRYYEIGEGDGLTRRIRTPLEEAIHDVLGGPAAAAVLLGIPRQNVHYWLSTKRLRDRDIAVRLADATRAKGCEVPAVELLDLAPWRGPQRHDPSGRRRRGPNGSSPRPISLAERKSAGEGGDAAAPTGKLRTSKRKDAPKISRKSAKKKAVATSEECPRPGSNWDLVFGRSRKAA